MRRSTCAAALLAALAATPLPAQRPISVGVAGGVSFPQGNFGDVVDVGWHALGTLALSTLMQPLGLRLDGAFNEFGLTDEGTQRALSVTLNPTYRLPMTSSPFSPYVIAGAGAYHLDCSGDASCDGTTRFGWNAGAGTKVTALGLRAFVEARYHHVAFEGPDVHYVPLTVGLMF
jgi:hypothetical protein